MLHLHAVEYTGPQYNCIARIKCSSKKSSAHCLTLSHLNIVDSKFRLLFGICVHFCDWTISREYLFVCHFGPLGGVIVWPLRLCEHKCLLSLLFCFCYVSFSRCHQWWFHNAGQSNGKHIKCIDLPGFFLINTNYVDYFESAAFVFRNWINTNSGIGL